MNFLLVVIFVVIAKTTFAKRGGSCTTPNGENVKCVPVRTCKVIFDAVQSRNSSAVEFAKQSQCGFDSEPLVCCGSSGYPSPKVEKKINKNEVEVIVLSNFNTKALPDRTVCGLEKAEERVLGGEVAEIGEFPWMAALEYKSKRSGEISGIRCGGSLINNRYVVTAAHCIINREFQIISVWLGEWRISTDPDCHTLIECADRVLKVNIKTEIPHPFYSAKFGNNDIGLLRLAKDISYSDYIRPICLPPSNLPIPEFGANLTVAGWGAYENGSSSDIKLKVEVPLVENVNCKNVPNIVTVNANQLCAGGIQGKDSCQGDSGGPLMRTYEEKVSRQVQWYQEGIVSLGVGCGSFGYPAIYTRVSRYTSWIISNIQLD